MYEKVNAAHPDKLADRIAGAIVDLAYKKQENPKIAVEVLIGHENCHIIAETSVAFEYEEIKSIVNRIVPDYVYTDYKEVPQDVHLADNQVGAIRCGDNGIFKGVPITDEQKRLAEIVEDIYEQFPSDGKYIISEKDSKLIICQSKCIGDEPIFDQLRKEFATVVINPLGYWDGGINSDTGCISENELITTSDGLVRIKDIKVGDSVLSKDGFNKVLNVINKGIKPTYRLYDKSGHTINATEDHKFLVFRNGEFLYKQICELDSDDLLVRSHMDVPETTHHIKRVFRHGRGNTLQSVLESDNCDVMYFLGMLVGDGWYSTENNTVFIAAETDDEAESIISLVKRAFNIDAKYYKYEKQKSNDELGYDRKVAICSKELCDLLYELGFSKDGARSKIIPDFVFKCNNFGKYAFLSGLFDTDGCVRNIKDGRYHVKDNIQISYSSSSERLIKDITTLLLSIGINTTVYHIENNINEKECCYGTVISGGDAWRINIVGDIPKRRFIEKIGFRDKAKSSKVKLLKCSREFEFDDCRSYPCYVVKKLIDLDNRLKYRYKLEKFADAQAISSNRNISYDKLTYILDLYGIYKDTDEYKYVHNLLNYAFVQYDHIECVGETSVYDIEVEHEHSFVANGFIVHNCTNRKLGSDMGDSVTGGGTNGKDLSKADVSVNIYAWLKAQETGEPVEFHCAIGDETIDGKPYSEIVKIAKDYIDSIGGFEKFSEYGLIRP